MFLKKRVHIGKATSAISSICFLLLFPGFFYYHSALGLGLFPPLLGGFFTPISILSASCLIPLFARGVLKGSIRITLIDSAFFAILALILFSALWGYTTGHAVENIDMLIWSISAFMHNLICYIVAKTTAFRSPYFIRALSILLIGICFIILSLSEGGYFSVHTLSIGQQGITAATYQPFARSIIVVGLVILAVCQSDLGRIAAFLSLIICLFLNGARTEFVLFSTIGASFLFLTLPKKSTFSFCLQLLMVLLFSGLILYWNSIVALIPQTRILQLQDIQNSSSAQTRKILLDNALSTIDAHPFWGDYGSYLDYGGIGSYAHNIMSAWVNLGFIGFCLYCFVLLMFVSKSILPLLLKKTALSDYSSLTYLFCTLTILAMLFSKNYTYMMFGFSVGLSTRSKSKRFLLD